MDTLETNVSASQIINPKISLVDKLIAKNPF